jgi:hypothetical protein
MPAEWSLSEIARLLAQPQHRLIYLCEKKTIVPDLGNAYGRGSSRRFSARNVLEFAVAIRLRGLNLPVETVGAILYALRSFESTVRDELPDFTLVKSLARPGGIGLRVLLSDGPRVYFELTTRQGHTRTFGGIELTSRRGTRTRSVRELEGGSRSTPGAAKVEVDVSQIARSLDLEP